MFGVVREIFISKNRNKHGRRYGFVRFEGVENAQNLEWKLDNIIFGGLKMHVNTPKFGRNKVAKTNSEAKKVANDVQKEKVAPWPAYPNSTMHHGSYAEVVARTNRSAGSRRIVSNVCGSSGGSWSSVYLDISESVAKRANEAWVGRLKILAMFDRVEDDLYWDISTDVSLKYMGADMVLLLGLTDEGAKQMMEEEKEGGATPFHSLQKWSPKLRIGYRLTWVNCWGLPLTACNTHQIRKVVAAIGDMVDVDDAVELVRRMDRVWVLIKTSWQPFIQHTINVHIQGEVYKVHIVEESGSNPDMCHCRKGSMYGSSEEVESEDSDVGTPTGVNRSTWSNGDEAEFTAAKVNAKAQCPGISASPAGMKCHMHAHVSGDAMTANAPIELSVTTTEAIAPPSGTQNPDGVTLSNGQRVNNRQKGKAIVHCAMSPTANGQSRSTGSCPLDTVATYPACFSDIHVDLQRSLHGNGVSDTIGNLIPDTAEELECERGKFEGEAQNETMGSHFSNFNVSRAHKGVLEGALGLSIHTPHVTLAQQIFSPPASKLQVYSQKRSSKKKFTSGLVHEPDLAAALDTELITLIISQPTDDDVIKCGPTQYAKTANMEDRPAQFQHEEAEFIHSKKQEAIDMGEMVKSLAVTNGSSQRDLAGKIMDMENRDQQEVQRLGSRRGSQ